MGYFSTVFLHFEIQDDVNVRFCERRSGIFQISPGCTTLRYMLDVLGRNLSENVWWAPLPGNGGASHSNFPLIAATSPRPVSRQLLLTLPNNKQGIARHDFKSLFLAHKIFHIESLNCFQSPFLRNWKVLNLFSKCSRNWGYGMCLVQFQLNKITGDYTRGRWVEVRGTYTFN